MTKLKKGIYEHYKGKRYEVLDLAIHTETQEVMVVYQALYKGDFVEGQLWIRPLVMFNEEIMVNGKLIPRFRFVSDK
jgi:hypothetical protein